ncbi:MAG: hypothetical protein ACI9CF_001878 [Candidatus Omnitrophota bacterium]|jgi:hypothetical protein
MFRIALLLILVLTVLPKSLANADTADIAETIVSTTPEIPIAHSPNRNWQKFIDRNHSRLKQKSTITSIQVPITNTGVLVSSTNPNIDESAATSHSEFFKPVISSLDIQPLSAIESEFLRNLAKDMPDREIASRINAINAQQIKGASLNKIDYDFLVNLSDMVSDDKASIMLYSISKKRYQGDIIPKPI